VLQRDRIVGVDESVDRGDASARQNVLDKPFGGGAVARLPDAELSVGATPGAATPGIAESSIPAQRSRASTSVAAMNSASAGDRAEAMFKSVQTRIATRKSGKAGRTSEISKRIYQL
jgi:hypothetical protein